MRFAGMFFGKNNGWDIDATEAPCARLGRHTLWAEGCATDGGAMACAFGYMRKTRELTERLRQGGMRFDPDGGPGALALAAYRLWGEHFPEHIEGPVLIVIIDQDARRMYISRDRMGEQTVYYTAKGASVAFSDDPGTALQAPVACRAVDRDGLRELFALGPAHTPGYTPVKGLMELEPGCLLAADEWGHRIIRYFEFQAEPFEDCEQAAIRKVRDMVEDALDQVMCLNPSAMLSGGLDSTVLTALAAKRDEISTWSVCYEQDDTYYTGNDYQHERDTPYVKRASELMGTRHRQALLDPKSLFEGLHDALIARGMPGMADVDSSLLLFAREIAGSGRYVLSGECADEVFGGYPWFHREELWKKDGFPWSGSLELRETMLRPSVAGELALSDYAAARYYEACAREPRLAGENPEQARLRLIHGLCIKWFMPVLQSRARSMCLAAGVQALTPYCDDRLARYLYNVPWSVKNMGGRPKGLLREAMRDLLPEDLLNRRKSPYPKTHHPEYTRLVCRKMAGVLKDESSPILELVDKDEVFRQMSLNMNAAGSPWFGQLMSGPQMIAYLLQINDFFLTYKLELDV